MAGICKLWIGGVRTIIETKEQYQQLIKQFSRKGAYEIYISSATWRRKREERLKIDRYECVACGEKENLHVHHKYPSGYKNIPFEDVNYDLKTYCKHCHEALHNSINKRRYQNRDIKIQPYISHRGAERQLTSYVLEDSTIHINGRKPIDPSQWRSGKSAKSDSEGPEENLWKAQQDRSRFRGIG